MDDERYMIDVFPWLKTEVLEAFDVILEDMANYIQLETHMADTFSQILTNVTKEEEDEHNLDYMTNLGLYDKNRNQVKNLREIFSSDEEGDVSTEVLNRAEVIFKENILRKVTDLDKNPFTDVKGLDLSIPYNLSYIDSIRKLSLGYNAVSGDETHQQISKAFPYNFL